MNKRFEYLTVSLTSDEKTKELIFYIAEQKFLYKEYKTGLFEFLGYEGWELVSTAEFIGTESKNIGIIPLYAQNYQNY